MCLDANVKMAAILHGKGIPHWLDIYGDTASMIGRCGSGWRGSTFSGATGVLARPLAAWWTGEDARRSTSMIEDTDYGKQENRNSFWDGEYFSASLGRED